MNFQCLKNCALCCHYKVCLSPIDVKIIKEVVNDNNFLVRSTKNSEKSIGYLRRIGNVCLFLNKEEKICTIYPQRPIYCRDYPFIKEMYFDLEIDINLSCPGINYGEEISISDFRDSSKNVLNDKCEKELNEIKTKINKLEITLSKRNCYTSIELSPYIGKLLIENILNDGIERGILLLQKRIELSSTLLREFGNISERNTVERLLENMLKNEVISENNISSQEFLKNEFSHPILNTKLNNREVIIYRIEYDSRSMVWNFSGTERKVKFSDLEKIYINKDGENLLIEYIKFWMNRQILFRLVYLYAITDIYARNSLFFYLKVLLDILLRIYLLTKIITIKEDKKEANVSEVKEAIRSSDSFLRSRCQMQFKIEEVTRD